MDSEENEIRGKRKMAIVTVTGNLVSCCFAVMWKTENVLNEPVYKMESLGWNLKSTYLIYFSCI